MATLGLSATVRAIPAEVARDVAIEFAKSAERHGGRMMGRFQLTAVPGRVTITDTEARVQMRGTPAGFWSWREYGTKPHSVSPRKKQAMNHGLDHPVSTIIEGVHMPARHKWTAAVDDFEAGYGALVGAVVDRTWK
jgi:hypothetical protein